EETGDRPAMQPEVKMTNEDWKPGEDVIVEMSYEALPEIPETDLKAIKLEKLVVEPAEAEITEALEKLAGTAQTYADRRKGSKAKDGDQVIIDFVGKLGDEPFEGGSAEDYPLVLGSESFIPGFEAQLVGAKAEDDITVTVTFPENYGAENLKGQEATFDVKVKAVKAPKPAEIDDELAKQFGAEDLDGLKTQVAERLKTEFGGAARAVMKRALLDELDTAVSFEVPPSLLDAEAGQIAHQLYHEEHPDDHGHDHGEIEPSEEHLKLAERRVRLGLLLAEIGRKAEVTVSDNEMTQAVMAQARQFPGQERQFFEYVRQNQALQQQIRAPLFEDKVVDYVFELAEVTEKPVSKDELQAAVEKLEEE
ncbi:trigger factor, partial [Rhodovulum sulfidophilum]